MSLLIGSELQAFITATAAALPVSLVNIPGGTFSMGASDLGDRAKPVHRVAVSPFQMATAPVTVGEHRALLEYLGPRRFALLVGSAGTRPKMVALAESAEALEGIPVQEIFKDVKAGELLVEGGQGVFSGLKVIEMKMPDLDSKFSHPNKPMVVVSWYEALVHALLRGAILATEAQWEYAATCGGRFRHGTSSGELKPKEAHYPPHSEGATAEVDRYPANAWGLLGMTGNVWEWVMDWLGAYPSDGQSDPTGSANGQYRVLRGGSWYGSAEYLRAAFRGFNNPDVRNGNIGFRLAAPPQDS